MAGNTPKTHKTIFGTTEKSNFILNMTNNQFNKFASAALSAGFILIFIFSGIAEILSHAEISESTYDWRIIPSVALALTGLAGISIFIIALIKQTLDKKQIAASIIMLLLAVFMYISYVNAVTTVSDYSAFLGNRYGRYEGMMVHLSYIFIFLGSMSVNSRSALKKILTVFSLVIIFETIWSALQFIPSFPNTYYSIPYLIKNPMLPSGSAGSPVFLAGLLSAGLTVSVFGAMSEKTGVSSVIYKISTLFSSFFLVKTQSLIGMTSAGLILISVIIFLAADKKKKTLSSTPVILMITGFAAALAFIFIKGFGIYDGEIIWHDGCRRLGAFGQYTTYDEKSFDIHSIPAFYSYLWHTAAEYISKFPITGLGPDAFLLPQSSGAMNSSVLSFDRPYNEYLFYAATLGIPSAVAFTAALVYSAVNGIRKAVSDKNWINYAAAVFSVVYIITSFITNSTATVTPFVWFMLGLCCCTFKEEEK